MIQALTWLSWGLLGGCESDCTGVVCEYLYTAGVVSVSSGGALALRGQGRSPFEDTQLIEGSAAQGYSWSFLLGEDRLFLGTPDTARVHFLPQSSAEDRSDIDSLTSGVIEGDAEWERLGDAMAWVPDMSGDGQPELLIGAPHRSGSGESVQAGGAFLYFGLSEGWSGTISPEDADFRVVGSRNFAHLGGDLTGCPDLDGDGLGELLISSRWAAGVDPEGEEAIALAGRVHWVSASELSREVGYVLDEELPVELYSTQVGAQLGAALRCEDDLLEEEGIEILLSAPFVDVTDEDSTLRGAGEVYILQPATLSGSQDVQEAAMLTLQGTETESYFGASIATGDVDGDGNIDLAVGVPGAADGSGEVHLFLGARLRAGSIARIVIQNQGIEGHLGHSVEFADLDADGFDDLLIGSPRMNLYTGNASYGSGAVHIYAGRSSASEWSALTNEDADSSYSYPAQYLELGSRIQTGEFDGEEGEDFALGMRVNPESGLSRLLE